MVGAPHFYLELHFGLWDPELLEQRPQVGSCPPQETYVLLHQKRSSLPSEFDSIAVGYGISTLTKRVLVVISEYLPFATS